MWRAAFFFFCIINNIFEWANDAAKTNKISLVLFRVQKNHANWTAYQQELWIDDLAERRVKKAVQINSAEAHYK